MKLENEIILNGLNENNTFVINTKDRNVSLDTVNFVAENLKELKLYGTKKLIISSDIRQNGKTTCAYLYGLINVLTNRDINVVLLGRNYSWAKQLKEKIVNAYNSLVEECGKQSLPLLEVIDNRHLKFSNGSIIHLGSYGNNESVRGLKIDLVILDDAENVSREFMVHLLPTLFGRDALLIFVVNNSFLLFDSYVYNLM